MDKRIYENFSQISGELCNLLYVKDYNKAEVNAIIDELNAKPYTTELFVVKHDAAAIITALCLNIKPADEFLAAKSSHLINAFITKQNLQFDTDSLFKVVSWHIKCLQKCSDVILPDILYNLQCILQYNPSAGYKFTEELIGYQGLLINLINNSESQVTSSQNPLQICLIALKCVVSLVSLEDGKEQITLSTEVKEHISQIIVNFLLRGSNKTQDESLYCKAVISALRALSQLYFNYLTVKIPLPEVMGICRYFVLYGIVNQNEKPEKIMPAQQTIAASPVVAYNSKGGKKPKTRRQRNNVAENLKKEIPVSDRSLMKDVNSFENSSAYTPASKNYLETQKPKNCWALTSDSDMSDVENSKEAKLVALRSRVRQSASNLLLVLVKVRERRGEIFGYWWALFPDSPDVQRWSASEASRKTLAYCAVADPIASSRASVLSVILALLSGSKPYLSQAESSKRDNSSFIPFSVSLGYVITCMHKVLVGILDTERSQAVVIVTLKCCSAMVQATPYHKMKEGLISELVKVTRRFLVHKDDQLQVGALITMGCVLSIHPKVDEILKAFDKDATAVKSGEQTKETKIESDDCDDFEEGYSDDEMFTAVEQPTKVEENNRETHYFKSWILDICFKNMGWVFRGAEITRCKPSSIQVILESLQVLSAVAFNHVSDLLKPHLVLLGEILSEMLQHEHHDVVLQAARTVGIIGDALQKLEHSEQSAPLPQCVRLWEQLLPPLFLALQSADAQTKAMVCDCIANVGERVFKELSSRQQMLCCALLSGSCSDEEVAVRAAAVRALAMIVVYKILRQDIYVVTDCGENVLRALAETSVPALRTKAAWALGTLSDALVLNMDDPEADEIDDDLLLRLLEVSILCATDHDKVKMSATRGLGNLLRLMKRENLNSNIKPLCEAAIGKLLDCACKVSNMKVRWNACYALGNAMKNENLFTCFSGWQHQVFTSLCTLMTECKNLKVRINAASALRAPSTRDQYGIHFSGVWRGVMAAMENAANVDDFTEYKHKDNLIEQLCVTLAHMCCCLKTSDLIDILDPLVFHYDCAKALFTQLCHKLPPENASCLKILQAAKYVTVDLTANGDSQQQSLGMLQEIFIWDL